MGVQHVRFDVSVSLGRARRQRQSDVHHTRMSYRGHFPLSGGADSRLGRGRSAGGVMSGGIEHLDFGVRNTLLYYKDLKTTLELTPAAGADAGAVGRLLDSERVAVSELFD